MSDQEFTRAPRGRPVDQWDDDDRTAVFDLLERPAWHREAACRGSDPDLFFPGRGDYRATSPARQICAACPVREPCLEAGMSEHFGTWGGMSERARRRLRRIEREGDAA